LAISARSCTTRSVSRSSRARRAAVRLGLASNECRPPFIKLTQPLLTASELSAVSWSRVPSVDEKKARAAKRRASDLSAPVTAPRFPLIARASAPSATMIPSVITARTTPYSTSLTLLALRVEADRGEEFAKIHAVAPPFGGVEGPESVG